ncbi:MAG: glycine cleavage system protein GcvH [Deltaproteobacteria bacterium]|nr:glycine cleavage system protein GcvH [Deltaproteobacteria bacterium]MBW2305728.1 glycine cleavage system protein GcvH [Deltaproteobacteria bacterium]
MNFPDELRYAKTHEWARKEGGEAVVGITDFAQDALGDVVFVDLPQEGVTFKAGDVFGSIESVKAVSELYAPLSGEVAAINNGLEEHPEWVNDDPYGQGWMIRLRPSSPDEWDRLETAESYKKGLEREE